MTSVKFYKVLRITKNIINSKLYVQSSAVDYGMRFIARNFLPFRIEILSEKKINIMFTLENAMGTFKTVIKRKLDILIQNIFQLYIYAYKF